MAEGKTIPFGMCRNCGMESHRKICPICFDSMKYEDRCNFITRWGFRCNQKKMPHKTFCQKCNSRVKTDFTINHHVCQRCLEPSNGYFCRECVKLLGYSDFPQPEEGEVSKDLEASEELEVLEFEKDNLSKQIDVLYEQLSEKESEYKSLLSEANQLSKFVSKFVPKYQALKKDYVGCLASLEEEKNKNQSYADTIFDLAQNNQALEKVIKKQRTAELFDQLDSMYADGQCLQIHGNKRCSEKKIPGKHFCQKCLEEVQKSVDELKARKSPLSS